MTGTVRDPVCGMPLQAATALVERHRGEPVYFCSELCRREFLGKPLGWGRARGRLDVPLERRRIAYFSMEVAIDPRMPTYAGGLGVLAADTLRSDADLHVPVVGVSLVHRNGYFAQTLGAGGSQIERPASWSPELFLQPVSAIVPISIEGRTVQVRAWQHDVIGHDGFVVPLLLLDTDVPGNAERDRRITDVLYGGGEEERLRQEIVLGIGGVRMLRALGCLGLEKFHLNEGHASLAAIEILLEHAPGRNQWDFDYLRNRCVFTTHTPVPAGHDRFEHEMVGRMLGDQAPGDLLRMLGGDDRLNMTRLALNSSFYVNGVARKHAQVSEEMFPGYQIHHVTNGVHSVTWTCDSFRELYDHHIAEWREDPAMLRKVLGIPAEQVWRAHHAAKLALMRTVETRTGVVLSPDVLTIGFARRATVYKRADLLLRDLSRLRRMAAASPLQIVFAGKAHPRDDGGKDVIRRIFQAAGELGEALPIVYLPEYDLDLARLLVSGVDLWLNTPRRPLEASGTSGMKAAHNGVPSFSILDGWWIEGHVEGITGWSIGAAKPDGGDDDARDASDLYDKLEKTIVPLFYRDRSRWIATMQGAIALNASFFNTHRMVQQYATHAYL